VTRATPLRIDTAACDRCGRCVPKCAPKALRVGPGYIFVEWETCTGCGKCADACDRGAIAVRGVEPQADVASSRTVPIGAARAKADTRGASKVPAVPKTPKAAAVRAGLSGGPVPWTLSEGALVLLVAFALLIGAQALPSGLASAPVWAGVTLLVYDAALAGLLWYLAHRHGVRVVAAFRLDALPELRNVLLAVGVGIGCRVLSVAYYGVAQALGAQPPVSDVLTRAFGTGAAGVALTVIVVAVVGPVLEEVLLRGVVLGAAASKVGAWPAIVGCALAFALLHASLWSMLPLTILGIGLGWLAVRSRSLWPAILAHVLYNGVLIAAAFYAAH
jgi:membrane protease YdiL (CAAX protease family)/NAD-dependent dihydropyrimidine dehydrogenase PreA subunit